MHLYFIWLLFRLLFSSSLSFACFSAKYPLGVRCFCRENFLIKFPFALRSPFYLQVVLGCMCAYSRRIARYSKVNASLAFDIVIGGKTLCLFARIILMLVICLLQTWLHTFSLSFIKRTPNESFFSFFFALTAERKKKKHFYLKNIISIIIFNDSRNVIINQMLLNQK